MDVTDIVDYNVDVVNQYDLKNSFFHLDRTDPTRGFVYDASVPFGPTWPLTSISVTSSPPWNQMPQSDNAENLLFRLILGSHLAQHLRHQLEEQKGYTSTVGISTNKLLSKLVGNVNKPKGQTTLVPPYHSTSDGRSNVNLFVDDHDVGKIPGIGFKIAQKIRSHVLGRAADFDAGLVYGGTKENVKVGGGSCLSSWFSFESTLRLDQHQERVELTLGSFRCATTGRNGASSAWYCSRRSRRTRDLADRIWGLINGVDNSEVAKAKEVPQQISIVCTHTCASRSSLINHGSRKTAISDLMSLPRSRKN